jgi:eukaryotic-like serine/threonine-protein kinase
MDADRWHQVTQLYQATLAREARDRPAFLADACAGDAALRAEIEWLLAQEPDASRFTATPGQMAAARVVDKQLRLEIGRPFGTYRIVSLLGAGGMGEVYRAHDSKLRRDVAIKVLAASFADDPDRLQRFEREARLLAALNHPNVGGIHGLEERDGIHALVLELIEGDTLAERLEHGPVSLGHVLTIAKQITEALEAAHEQAIIHRDLKPANIKITPDGIVKVLDFGLGKACAGPTKWGDLSASPTTTIDRTQEGVILGTAAYMSPEQVRGKALDERTDIWAYGCVLYEMLTGRRAFRGDTVSDTIAAVLEREPDWRALPNVTPPGIRRLVRRCLEKDPKRRLRDIGDARLEIEDTLHGAKGLAPDRVDTPRAKGRAIGRMAAVLLSGGLIGAFIATRSITVPMPVRTVADFPLALPSDVMLASLDFPATTISPDGSLIAYVATRGGQPQLFVRRLDDPLPKVLAGTEDAIGPFFSPDSRWIGFFADGKLKKVSVAGGAPISVSDAPIGFGGSWGRDDVIVFAPTSGSGLSRVNAAGGSPMRVTTLDQQKGEFSHRWPAFLPDGDSVLFTVGTQGTWDDASIAAQSLSSGRRYLVLQGGTNPHYLPTGHLLYAHGGAIFAARFDPSTMKVSGTPVRVLESVVQSFDGVAQLSVAESGSAVYVQGRFASSDRQLMMVDRRGNAIPLTATARPYSAPRVSPDGRKLLVTITGTEEALWTYDITNGALNQLTFETNSSFPAWTHDGQRIAFSSNRAGALNLFAMGLDGTSGPERLAPSTTIQFAGSWSPDGRMLAFVERHPTTGRDIWMLPLSGDHKPYPFLNSPSDESTPRFSPDGRLLAYVTNESGRDEVYVRLLADRSRIQRVSVAGGTEPVWSSSARELFYRLGDQMMSVKFGPRDEPLGSEILFRGNFEPGTLDLPNYDVMPDGQRFVMVNAAERDLKREFHVKLHWLDTLGSLLSRADGNPQRP